MAAASCRRSIRNNPASMNAFILSAPVSFSFVHHDSFQGNIVRGLPNAWHCPAGGRFLYICEEGLVHYCSQQRGHPGDSS